MSKISQAEAVYFPRAYIDPAGLGSTCGKCRDFITLSSECVIVDPPLVSGARGTCTQYIRGTNQFYGQPRKLIPAALVGYIEGKDVPTYCGRCEYYGGDQYKGPCAKVEGVIEYGGCCDLYKAQ